MHYLWRSSAAPQMGIARDQLQGAGLGRAISGPRPAAFVASSLAPGAEADSHTERDLRRLAVGVSCVRNDQPQPNDAALFPVTASLLLWHRCEPAGTLRACAGVVFLAR